MMIRVFLVCVIIWWMCFGSLVGVRWVVIWGLWSVMWRCCFSCCGHLFWGSWYFQLLAIAVRIVVEVWWFWSWHSIVIGVVLVVCPSVFSMAVRCRVGCGFCVFCWCILVQVMWCFSLVMVL